MLLANILEKPRTHAAAQHRVQHIERKAELVRQRISRHTHGDVDLFERLLILQNEWRVRFWDAVGRHDFARVHVREFLADHVHQFFMVEITGGRDENVLGRIDAAVVFAQHSHGGSSSPCLWCLESVCLMNGLSRNY